MPCQYCITFCQELPNCQNKLAVKVGPCEQFTMDKIMHRPYRQGRRNGLGNRVAQSIDIHGHALKVLKSHRTTQGRCH